MYYIVNVDHNSSIQEPKTQCGMPKDFKLKHHCCESLKSCILNIDCKNFYKNIFPMICSLSFNALELHDDGFMT